jgi:hypothetical protein
MLRRAELVGLLLFAAFMLAATYRVATTPDRSFDSYFYSYLVSQDAPTFKALPGLPHEFIEMPDREYWPQEPFYTVKVLFVALVRVAAPYVGVLQAPTAISAAAYFLCGWVVWFWLRSLGVNVAWRTIAACLVMYSSVVMDAARMGTPDLLCTLFLVAAAWLLSETKQTCLGACLLILAVCTRIDSLLLGGLLLALAWWQKKVSFAFTSMFGVAMLACYLAISRMGYPLGQLIDLLLENSNRTSYVDALLHNLLEPEVEAVAPFVLLALIALKLRYQVGLIVICAVSLVLRYMLFPNLEVRYLVPHAVIVAVVAAAAVLRERPATVRR